MTQRRVLLVVDVTVDAGPLASDDRLKATLDAYSRLLASSAEHLCAAFNYREATRNEGAQLIVSVDGMARASLLPPSLPLGCPSCGERLERCKCKGVAR